MKRTFLNKAASLLALLCASWLLTASAPAQQAEPQSQKPTEELYTGYDIVDLYDEARANLQKICDDYRRIKAIELSKIRNIPYQEAFDNISSVMPMLEDPDRELLRQAIRDPKDIKKHKKEVKFVESEVENMIALAAELLDEIEKVQMEILNQQHMEMPEETLEEIVQKEEFDPDFEPPPPPEVQVTIPPEIMELQEAAKEEEDKPAKDLTQLMRPLMIEVVNMKDLTSEEQEKGEPEDLFKSSNDMAGITSITDYQNVNKSFGRRIAEGGPQSEWLFVNSWYTIGPFPNPHRRNIHTKFPPETVVDLNATYNEGKGGSTVKWEYVTANKLKIQPANPTEYAIYYAYTEIYCDRPMDLWVAIGSDDKGNVWLNDLPIWISGDALKGWRPNEGFRKVSFRKGVNKILFRVENGWIDVRYSFAIRVAP